MSDYVCPQCGDDQLEVVVQVWARLWQDTVEDNVETDLDEASDTSHYFGDHSLMRCLECDYSGKAIEFFDAAASA